MKTRTVAFSILTVTVLSLAFGYAYHLGYSRGSAEERLHWLVSDKEGVWTTRENPAHPIFKPAKVVVRGVSSVNSIPVTYSP